MATNHKPLQTNLTCSNCLYCVTYETRDVYFSKNTATVKHIFSHTTYTTCLLQKHNKLLNALNKYNTDSTCDNHILGNELNSVLYSTPIADLITETTNPKLKTLFAYRSDIVETFRDDTKLREFTLADKNKWNTNDNKP